MSNHMKLTPGLSIRPEMLQAALETPTVAEIQKFDVYKDDERTLYNVSTGADFLSESNALKQAAYEAEEESIADMIRNFEVGRNWNYIMGLADILKSYHKGKETNDGYSRAVGFPAFDHLLSYGRASESAYMQGLSDNPMEIDTTKLTRYYANVIVDREAGGKAIIDAFNSGSTFLLTPTELEAYNLATSWKNTAIAAQPLPQDARGDNEFTSVMDKWDNPTGTTQRTRPQTESTATTALIRPGSAALLDLKDQLVKVNFGSILPRSDASIAANTARIFALIGISYAAIQAYEYLRKR